MLSSLTDSLIFAAPEPSYTASDMKGSLCWLPWNDTIPKPHGAATSQRSTSGCGTGCSGPQSRLYCTGQQKHTNASDPVAAAAVAAAALPCLWLQAPRAGTIVLYFHANAEDLGMVFPAIRHLHEQLQVSVLAVEYPGYGMLKAMTASEAGICSAALVALRYLVDEIGVDYKQVVVLGRSLGSGPAVYLASRFPVGGLILVNGFVSIRAAVETHAGRALANLAFRDIFANERLISNVSCGVLFIHASSDRMVPPEHSVRLFERCRSRKLLITPDKMEHNSHLFSDPSFLVLPVIHFFHFPSYQTEQPPRLPPEVFVPPSVASNNRGTPRGEVCKIFSLPRWLCLAPDDPSGFSGGGGGAADTGSCEIPEGEDIAVPPTPLDSVHVPFHEGAHQQLNGGSLSCPEPPPRQKVTPRDISHISWDLSNAPSRQRKTEADDQEIFNNSLDKACEFLSHLGTAGGTVTFPLPLELEGTVTPDTEGDSIEL